MSETPWTVRLVDKPEVGRTTRLDLNMADALPQPGQWYTLDSSEGFTLGVGEKEVVVSESMLSDGQTPTTWRRVNREIVIPLAVVGESTDLATLQNALARELDRPTNWLEFNPSDHTGEAVFYELVPGSNFDEVELNSEAHPDEKGLQVTLTCKPAGVGLPVTGSGTVSNNPAAATNPQVLTLSTVKGDVASPLNVEVKGASGSTSLGATHLLNVHTNPATPANPATVLLQAEAATTLGGTTTVQSNDAAMSGSGSNYTRSTFTTGEAFLLRWENLNISCFGTYKVLVRVRKSSAAATFTLRRELTTIGADTLTGATVPYAATSFATDRNWIDLGPITFPVGSIKPGTTSGVVGHLSLYAARTSGTGTLDVDCVKLVPTETQGGTPITTAITWRSSPTLASVVLGHDSESGAVYTYVGSSHGVERTRTAGDLPRVHPGTPNHIVLMPSVGQVPYGVSNLIREDVISWNADVTWTYRPRWLYLSAPA